MQVLEALRFCGVRRDVPWRVDDGRVVRPERWCKLSLAGGEEVIPAGASLVLRMHTVPRGAELLLSPLVSLHESGGPPAFGGGTAHLRRDARLLRVRGPFSEALANLPDEYDGFRHPHRGAVLVRWDAVDSVRDTWVYDGTACKGGSAPLDARAWESLRRAPRGRIVPVDDPQPLPRVPPPRAQPPPRPDPPLDPAEVDGELLLALRRVMTSEQLAQSPSDVVLRVAFALPPLGRIPDRELAAAPTFASADAEAAFWHVWGRQDRLAAMAGAPLRNYHAIVAVLEAHFYAPGVEHPRPLDAEAAALVFGRYAPDRENIGLFRWLTQSYTEHRPEPIL